MTADIVKLHPRQTGEPVAVPDVRAVVGDMLVICVSVTAGLWAAWPVVEVDADGRVKAVGLRDGGIADPWALGASRLGHEPIVFRAVEHDVQAFAAMGWRTWRSRQAVVEAFAAITKGGRHV